MFDATWFQVIAVIAIALQGLELILALFQPGLRYKIRQIPSMRLDSEEFICTLEAICDAKIHRNAKVDVFTNGENFYEAELEAIRSAEHSINIEAYIFEKGKLTQRFLEALIERARAGVKVKMTLDAVGSFATWDSYLRELREAGGRVCWYHRLAWYLLPRFNNRTHRELLIVDGRVGFIGGAGFGDHWIYSKPKHPRWRDMMCRVEGDAVTGLQACFVENWLEASGEILSGREQFQFLIDEDNGAKGDSAEDGGDARMCPPKQDPQGHSTRPAYLVINSSPSVGRSTRNRILFQTLIASAKESICLSTPYFLPDWSARRELIRAVQRGVKVTILTPGHKADHLLTRSSSRRLYGGLLKAGAEIYEYQPSMFHVKCLIVDDTWSVVGSTNFDYRSFGINDEVNMASFDVNLAARLHQDFAEDLKHSELVNYRRWRRRHLFERMVEFFGGLIEQQQ